MINYYDQESYENPSLEFDNSSSTPIIHSQDQTSGFSTLNRFFSEIQIETHRMQQENIHAVIPEQWLDDDSCKDYQICKEVKIKKKRMRKIKSKK